MIDVALLSVIRRWHLREGVSIRAIARRTGLSRNTIRKYLANGRTVEFRIGINVGDVIVDRGDIYGEGIVWRRVSRASLNPVVFASLTDHAQCFPRVASGNPTRRHRERHTSRSTFSMMHCHRLLRTGVRVLRAN